jgi:hypothetical protein
LKKIKNNRPKTVSRCFWGNRHFHGFPHPAGPFRTLRALGGLCARVFHRSRTVAEIAEQTLSNQGQSRLVGLKLGLIKVNQVKNTHAASGWGLPALSFDFVRGKAPGLLISSA